MFTSNAKQNSLTTLTEMLRHKRPSGNDRAISAFADKFLQGWSLDGYGNRFLLVPYSEGYAGPRVVWAAHLDTVARVPGEQAVVIEGDNIQLAKPKSHNCLGADCTTGVWLAREMANAKVPGLYYLYLDEECGGLGSTWAAKNERECLEQYQICVSFDRYGTNSIITHQGSMRTCSDAFAHSFAGALGSVNSNRWALDDTGLFTDSAVLADGVIAEATNLSVGYNHHHTSRECQSISHALALRKALLTLGEEQQATLAVERDPYLAEYEDFYSMVDKRASYDWHWSGADEMEQAVKSYPEAAAELLLGYGVSADELREAGFKHRYSGF